MASTARIFFAGIGTAFLILAIGFGGGLLIAKSALHDQPMQARTSSGLTHNVRVVLPSSAEPAIQVSSRALSEPIPQVQAAKEVQAPIGPQPDKVEPRKAERDLKAERRRYAERKAKRVAAIRARQQQTERQARVEPAVMAFGGDVSRTNFFGN